MEQKTSSQSDTDAAPEFLKLQIEDRVALVTLDRPDRLNAIGNEMGRQLDRVMVALALNAEVRAVVLTGAGRAFCAGADFERLSGFSESAGSTLRTPEKGKAQGRYQALEGLAPPELLNRYNSPQALPQPIIAAVNGPCVGIGLALAVMCDVRFAAPEAFFTAPFARRGLIAETALAKTLPALIGQGAAADMLLSGRRVATDEAVRLGLVQHTAPLDRLVAEALAYAHDIAENVSPRSTRIIKRQLWLARSQATVEALDLSMIETQASTRSRDFAEGLAHFREKRPPRFSGD